LYARSLAIRVSLARNLSRIKSASFPAMSSFLFLMMAVCGIGTPKGWRNSATTANQSARAPTMAASAKAASHSQAPCPDRVRATTNRMAAPTISPVAILLFLISSRFL